MITRELRVSTLVIQKGKAVHEEAFEPFADWYCNILQLETITVVRKSHKLKCDIRALQGLVFPMGNAIPHHTPIQCQIAIPFSSISSGANQPHYSPVNFRPNISSQPHKKEHHREGLSQFSTALLREKVLPDSLAVNPLQAEDELREENMQQEVLRVH